MYAAMNGHRETVEALLLAPDGGAAAHADAVDNVGQRAEDYAKR
jgi:ankyrin repeat protein